MMKLFFSPGACSLACHAVLFEADAQFEAYKVDIKNKKGPGGEDFLKINPKGQVPALMTADGHLLTEGAVIMQYICDQKPAANVLPKMGTWERYQANEWLNYVSSEVHKTLGAMWGLDRMYSDADVKSKVREATWKTVSAKLDFLNKHFEKNQFLMGASYSAADTYLFTVLGWAKPLGFSLDQWPQVTKFMGQIQTRPATIKAMKSEGLIPA